MGIFVSVNYVDLLRFSFAVYCVSRLPVSLINRFVLAGARMSGSYRWVKRMEGNLSSNAESMSMGFFLVVLKALLFFEVA